MTGAGLARSLVGHEHVKQTLAHDCYHPETGCIYLSAATYEGTDEVSLYCALHEVAHRQQHEQIPNRFALRWIPLMRLWLEYDAWRRADRMLRDMELFDPAIVRMVRDAALMRYRQQIIPQPWVA
jgi:Zn-dependent membrane protease YugP